MIDWKILYERYLNKDSSPEEVRLLLLHFNLAGNESPLREMIEAQLSSREDISIQDNPEVSAAFQRIENRLFNRQNVVIKPIPWAFYAAAVSIVLLGSVFFFYHSRTLTKNDGKQVVDITPGSNRATLTLSNGRQINLDSAKVGIQMSEKGFVYNDGSSIPSVRLPDTASEVVMKLSTPNGGQYQVILSDGTKVWLNAASTLTYPSKFTNNERTVELTGEACFNVPQNRRSTIPFVVRNKGQSITVMGTTFNVCAYAEENHIKTTLIKGSVRVSTINNLFSNQLGTAFILKPGEQSVLSHAGTLKKQKADMETEIGWRNGVFFFRNTPFQDMMRQIARWYDVEIVYRGDIPSDSISGKIDKSVSLKTLLQLLGESGNEIRLEGKKMIVSNKKGNNYSLTKRK
ncbi:FecR family protein [bacterium A37T11]|nr:FecR family protein [bacterium A37T11]